MQWDDIQRGAKAKGVLVYAIDQAQTPPMTQPGPWGDTRHGYCIGLGANWISLAYQGKDFPFSNQVCDNPPWQATMAQTIDANTGYTDWVNEWKVVTAPFACAVTGLKAERGVYLLSCIQCLWMLRRHHEATGRRTCRGNAQWSRRSAASLRPELFSCGG